MLPFIETNRGCPFACTFCHTGNSYYHKINKFSEEFKNVKVVQGGKTRSESSIIGLHACSEKTTNVLIHDAVRPFISQRLINEIIVKLTKYDAVIPASIIIGQLKLREKILTR